MCKRVVRRAKSGETYVVASRDTNAQIVRYTWRRARKTKPNHLTAGSLQLFTRITGASQLRQAQRMFGGIGNVLLARGASIHGDVLNVHTESVLSLHTGFFSVPHHTAHTTPHHTHRHAHTETHTHSNTHSDSDTHNHTQPHTPHHTEKEDRERLRGREKRKKTETEREETTKEKIRQDKTR